MTPFESAELAPLVAAAFDTRGTNELIAAVATIEQWWLDRPFRPWAGRSAQEARAFRAAVRADALARLLRETA